MTATELRTAAAKISFTLYAFDRSGAVRKLPLSQSGLRRNCGPPLQKYHLPYTLLTDPERCENCRYLKVDCDGNADRRCG